jgi:hypothetical protein
VVAMAIAFNLGAFWLSRRSPYDRVRAVHADP